MSDEPLTLCIDVGGTHLKRAVVSGTGAVVWGPSRLPTPRPALPEPVLAALLTGLVGPHAPRFQRVSVGFPGVVVDGAVHTAPNLDGAATDWPGFPLASRIGAALGVACRVANDADVQGFGAIEGRGVEMVLTLGTGMGAALFVDGHLVPNLELGHHPLQEGRTYEQLVGMAARERDGVDAWDAHLKLVLATVQRIFNPRRIWLGGGHAQDLEERMALPSGVHVVSNDAGLWGGLGLFRFKMNLKLTVS
jgi:polyphosphate glucokinase